MREHIDNIASDNFSPIFNNYLLRLQRAKQLKRFELFDNHYLVPIDGTQYFHSQKTHCDKCLVKHHHDESVSYAHRVLQAAIVHPNCRQVLPLMPEAIELQDGRSKQDCEINAAKRLLPKLRADHPKLKIIICGDGLYSKQSLIELVKS